MHRKVEVHLQNDCGEKSNAFEGGYERQRPRPLFTFFTSEEDEVHHFVDDNLEDEVGNEHTEEYSNEFIGCIKQKGVSNIVGDIEIVSDGQQQTGLYAEEDMKRELLA